VIGFGLNYGKAARKLAAELKIIDRVKADHPKWEQKTVDREAQRVAQTIIDKYFERIPGVAAFIQDTHRSVAERKYVETLSGRRRWLMEVMDLADSEKHKKEARRNALDSGWDPDRAACWCDDCRESRGGERKSVNTIIQGSAADIVQMAMVKMFDNPDLLCVPMVLQVHDEVAFECPVEVLDEASACIKHDMENPGFDDLRVPLRVSPGVGDNWIEAK
jgi:DNA polymerase-1